MQHMKPKFMEHKELIDTNQKFKPEMPTNYMLIWWIRVICIPECHSFIQTGPSWEEITLDLA